MCGTAPPSSPRPSAICPRQCTWPSSTQEWAPPAGRSRSRRARGVLVGPDNGLLLWAADALGGVGGAVELTSLAHRLAGPARTFDGRDVFAPAAAHLANGVALDELGPRIDPASLVRLPTPLVETAEGELAAEVRTVDHFGNVQLAATGDDLAASGLASAGRVAVVAGDRELTAAVGGTFGDVPAGALVLLVDAAGYVSLAVNSGRAADLLGVDTGSLVHARLSR